MNLFLRRFLTLLIPIILECLDEALDRKPIKEGRRSQSSKKKGTSD